MSYDELIDYFGSDASAALNLGVSPSTVSSWRHLDILPAYAAIIVRHRTERDAALAELAAARFALRELAKWVH